MTSEQRATQVCAILSLGVARLIAANAAKQVESKIEVAVSQSTSDHGAESILERSKERACSASEKSTKGTAVETTNVCADRRQLGGPPRQSGNPTDSQTKGRGRQSDYR